MHTKQAALDISRTPWIFHEAPARNFQGNPDRYVNGELVS